MNFNVSFLPDLHLEITSKCTLACPACPRTYEQGNYKVTDLPLEAIRSLISSSQRFKMVTLCGDHGDPIYHSQFHEVLKLLKELPDKPWISIATNGSYRSESWWKKTAEILDSRDEVIFGIDGLKDTSHLYRRKSDWDSIMTGISTLKKYSRCRVRWQWILFRFNQHQLPAAAKLANELKIDTFMIIGSSRHHAIEQWRPTISIADAENIFAGNYDLSPL